MALLYVVVSPCALANCAMAKSEAEYSSESDGSSTMKCIASYPDSRPRIGFPCVVPPATDLFISDSAAAVSKLRTPNAYAEATMMGPGSPVITKFSPFSCDHLGSSPPCWPSSTIDLTTSVITSGATNATSAAQER